MYYKQTVESFNVAKDLLTKCDTKFYTFTAKTEKPITLLLKGLNSSFNENEVLHELRSLRINDVEFNKISRFTTTRSKKEDKILPIFVVQISQNSQINNLKQIKYLFHQVIYWDKLKRREVIQCKKCQRIGHTASNCNLPYRCVKCEDKHEPGKCGCPSDTQLDRKRLFCVNCREYGHPASYRGCPKIIENKNRLANLRNANNDNKTNRLRDKTNIKNAEI